MKILIKDFLKIIRNLFMTFIFYYGAGVSSTNLKQRIYENYEQMKKKADNHFPQDVTTQEKQK